jgi:hypothetical protein
MPKSVSANGKPGFFTLAYPFWYSTDWGLGTEAEDYEFCYFI